MTNDHHLPSDQIAPYARGELDAARAKEFEAHLAGCAECRSELAGCQALLGDAGSALNESALNEMERARLHRNVLSATTGETTAPARRSIAARVAPALGAAALFALFAFAASQVFIGGSDSADESASDAGAALEAGEDGEAFRAGEELGLPPATGAIADGSTGSGGGSDDSGSDSEGEVPQAGVPEAMTAALQPYFEPEPRVLSESALRRLGRSRDPFVTFSAAFRAGDGTDRDAQTTSLAMASPEPGEVRACAAGVLSQDSNAVPAYGALGTFKGRYVLVLGFVTAPRASVRLDRYDIWVWEFGSCSSAAGRSPLDDETGVFNPLTRLQGRI